MKKYLDKIKAFLTNFLSQANTPYQVYLRAFLLSLIVIIPFSVITINRIYTYYKYKKIASKELKSIDLNREKILELANMATEVIEQESTTEQKEVNFLSDLGKIADDTDNEIVFFKPLPKKTITIGENIEIFPVDLELAGSFYTLVNFLEQIKKYDRICIVEKLKIEISKLNYPYVSGSIGVSLFPFINEKRDEVEQEFKINNDPFKPFNYEGSEAISKRKGDITLTGIIKEKQMWAIIEFANKSYIVKNGDVIGEDIKITSITANAVYLTKKDKLVKLKLKE